MQQILFSIQEPRVLVLVMILACVIGPIAEELFFRGVIFGALRRKTGRWAAMAISGAAFALVHTNVVGFVPIMALGCLLADFYDRTGMLLSPIAVHIVHNTLLMSLAIVFRQFLL
jgi:membrane protease YdiL (CAAX protease family)